MEQLKQDHLLNQHQQHQQQQQQQQHLIHLQQQQHVESMFTNQNRHAYHSNGLQEHTHQLIENSHIHILNHPGTELTNNLSYNPSQQMEPHNEYFTNTNSGIDNSKPLDSRLLNQLEIKRNIDDYSEIGTDDQDESSSCSSSTSNSSYNVNSIKNTTELISIKANFEADSSPGNNLDNPPATNTLTPIDTNQTSDSKESVPNIKVEIQCKDVMDVEDIKCVNKNFEADNLLSSSENHVNLEDDTESTDNHSTKNEMANVYRKFKINGNSMSSSEVNAGGFLAGEEPPKLVDKVKAEDNELEVTIQSHLDVSSQSS